MSPHCEKEEDIGDGKTPEKSKRFGIYSNINSAVMFIVLTRFLGYKNVRLSQYLRKIVLRVRTRPVVKTDEFYEKYITMMNAKMIEVQTRDTSGITTAVLFRLGLQSYMSRSSSARLQLGAKIGQ